MAICFRVLTRVRLGVTIFCILALPHVTLGVSAKEVMKLSENCVLGKLLFPSRRITNNAAERDSISTAAIVQHCM